MVGESGRAFGQEIGGVWRRIIRHLDVKGDLESSRDSQPALLADAGAFSFGNSTLYTQKQIYGVKGEPIHVLVSI
jgi:hypothetical protein